MDDMRRGLDFQKAEAALGRAAFKALHGTREEKSGRFANRTEQRGEAARETGPQPPRPRPIAKRKFD
jgi:hypothetical protein